MCIRDRLKPDKDVPEFVTPKMGYYYVLDAGSNIARVNWTVSGGSFSLGSSQTSIPGGNFYGITVYWDNVKSTNGSTPQGKLTAEVYYSSGVSGVQSASYTQKIKSLNGVTPPSLTSKTSTNLDYGAVSYTHLTFRIGNIGDIFPKDMEALIQAIKEIR